MSLRVEIWQPGQPLGNLSAERVAEIQGEFTGPVVAIIDDNDGINIIQPMNPDTEENWESIEAALEFGNRYITG